ncbi:M48 family metallopeptidase [Nocardioides caeni]|uniref:M48 family metallopeptidase n=1 Tax=Nocardioides caeni TaxID=574700 RepID=A0A4S8NNK3_9ACTN|nr:M48 family metallopeptidase [Nocardioides caeni]THV18500.1 M48 family metallopeptidase [Nocardioides caeni]
MDTRPALDRVALGTVIIGGAIFFLLAVTQVPWEPVPGGRPEAVPATSVFTDDQIARAEHFARWARAWSWSSLVVSLAVACWLGFGRRGRGLVERIPGWWWLRVIAAVVALTAVGRLVTLPFGIASRQLRLDEGLAAGSWAAWGTDLLTADAVTVIGTSLALIGAVGCARRWTRAWPAIVGVGAAVLVMIGSFVYPLVVEPLFNDFESLPDGSLRSGVLALAEAEDVEVDDVLVADASRRTTTLNAYVSGFGHTRRVVLYDNLVNGTPQAETLSVVAHELAHAKHDDVVTGTMLGAAGAMLGVGLLGLVLQSGRRRGMADVGSVPLVLALVALATVVTAPVQNGISRQIEIRADQTALAVTNDPDAFVDLQRRLAVRSHADPTPPAWSQWWFGSHPTVLERVGMATDLRESSRPR